MTEIVHPVKAKIPIVEPSPFQPSTKAIYHDEIPPKLAIQSPVVKMSDTRHPSPYWKQLVPIQGEDPRGMDIRITWDCPMHAATSESHVVARSFLNMVEEKRGEPLLFREELVEEVSEWMKCFEQYCCECLVDSPGKTILSAKLSCSRGPAATKCPKWHQDYVPLRWIQALVGPGCEWVEPFESEATARFVEQSNACYDVCHADFHDEGCEQDHSHSHNHCDSVKPLNCHIHQAKEGQAVLLLGKKWNLKSQMNSNLPAVTHKSPTGIPKWQGRVLLTMDVSELRV